MIIGAVPHRESCFFHSFSKRRIVTAKQQIIGFSLPDCKSCLPQTLYQNRTLLFHQFSHPVCICLLESAATPASCARRHSPRLSRFPSAVLFASHHCTRNIQAGPPPSHRASVNALRITRFGYCPRYGKSVRSFRSGKNSRKHSSNTRSALHSRQRSRIAVSRLCFVHCPVGLFGSHRKQDLYPA